MSNTYVVPKIYIINVVYIWSTYGIYVLDTILALKPQRIESLNWYTFISKVRKNINRLAFQWRYFSKRLSSVDKNFMYKVRKEKAENLMIWFFW